MSYPTPTVNAPFPPSAQGPPQPPPREESFQHQLANPNIQTPGHHVQARYEPSFSCFQEQETTSNNQNKAEVDDDMPDVRCK